MLLLDDFARPASIERDIGQSAYFGRLTLKVTAISALRS